MIDLSVNSSSLGPGDTGVGDENVETTIKFLDDLVDGILHAFGIGDIDLICPAWTEETL